MSFNEGLSIGFFLGCRGWPILFIAPTIEGIIQHPLDKLIGVFMPIDGGASNSCDQRWWEIDKKLLATILSGRARIF